MQQRVQCIILSSITISLEFYTLISDIIVLVCQPSIFPDRKTNISQLLRALVTSYYSKYKQFFICMSTPQFKTGRKQNVWHNVCIIRIRYASSMCKVDSHNCHTQRQYYYYLAHQWVIKVATQ